MTAPATDRMIEKRRRILDAARFLMLRNGLRATTMEAIAREAHIAKPTLYTQFPDKEAVYAALMDDLVASICGAFEGGISGTAPVAERVGDALAGKFGAVAALLGDSPHGEELYNEHGRVATRFAALDRQFEETVAHELTSAGASDGVGLARLVIAAAYGIGRKLRGEAAVRDAIRLMCRRVIGAELG